MTEMATDVDIRRRLAGAKLIRLELRRRVLKGHAGILRVAWTLWSPALLELLVLRNRNWKLASQSIDFVLLCFQLLVCYFGLFIKFRGQHHNGVEGSIRKGG